MAVVARRVGCEPGARHRRGRDRPTVGRELAQARLGVDVLSAGPASAGRRRRSTSASGVLLERYYHHLFTSDEDIADLCDELGLEIDWLPSSVAFFADGEMYPFTTPATCSASSRCSLPSRIRMGLGRAVAPAPLPARSGGFEGLTAHEWIDEAMGRQAWDRMWGPLCAASSAIAPRTSAMAWLWARLHPAPADQGLGERGGGPRVSARDVRADLPPARRGDRGHGGAGCMIDRPAAARRPGGGGLRRTPGKRTPFAPVTTRASSTQTGAKSYDAVSRRSRTGSSSACWTMVSRRRCAGYLEGLAPDRVPRRPVPVLELDRRFSPFYWTNVADPEVCRSSA